MRDQLPAVTFSMDSSESNFIEGFISGMTVEMSTDRHQGSVIKYSHGVLADEFDKIMDLKARANINAFGHMYEWKTLKGGSPVRLWRHRLIGRGGSREATWVPLVSHMPIPTLEERSNDPRDPASTLEPEQIAKWAQEGRKEYVFRHKARIIESGIPVTITPKDASTLAFPTWKGKPGFANFIQPRWPGQTGSFTKEWVSYWTDTAPKVWEATVKNTIEKDYGRMQSEVSKRRRKRSFGIYAASNVDAAIIEGRNQGRAFIKGLTSIRGSHGYSERYGDEW